MAETVGSLADKISIMELKIYHMREQTGRADATDAFREACGEKLHILQLQRDDLATELHTLLADLAAGRVVPKVYRQFKMYNDPQYRTRPETPASPQRAD
jgi:hypothetical protein